MDMDHDHGSEAACKINMLWNWYTVDACFISEQWHVRTVGAYAGTVVSIFFVAILVELFRRLAREYDRKILNEHNEKFAAWRQGGAIGDEASLSKFGAGASVPPPFRPSIAQQLVRSLFYFVQFSAGYMLMLMAMYYNGGIILAIFVLWVILRLLFIKCESPSSILLRVRTDDPEVGYGRRADDAGDERADMLLVPAGGLTRTLSRNPPTYTFRIK
ncbi:hypothetical protein DXG03_003447 [Asterophora parasitica]|uniref:Copper transport protein n=1 Tax=Asterophora parasitica TaxID=117018 RepID=A0A9P7G3L1_9AGAR|nr:hypothetical protein DXG03_003447 [Asterophora parasitica]